MPHNPIGLAHEEDVIAPRIRRELASLPTFDDLATLGQAKETLESMRELWGEATPEERYEMVHLMLQQVRVDVPNGCVISLFPFAPFIPLYRQMPLLVEREMGIFVPVWPVQDAEQALTIPRCLRSRQRRHRAWRFHSWPSILCCRRQTRGSRRHSVTRWRCASGMEGCWRCW